MIIIIVNISPYLYNNILIICFDHSSIMNESSNSYIVAQGGHSPGNQGKSWNKF